MNVIAKPLTICLNMIVKDESHIIESSLTKLCNKIKFDYWVISDTGSSDNTPDIINNFFKKKNIPGELKHDKWKDFGHNRTLALNYAYNKTDLLLIFDADDELIGNFQIPITNNFDSYSVKFSQNTIIYTRNSLINNRKKFRFVGVLHEYIECLERTKTQSGSIEGEYYIISGKTGNRSKQHNKYLNDAITLENAYFEAKQKNDPLFNRYSFYCANSYNDSGDIENAIKWYKTTLTLSGWIQEKYISCLKLFGLFEKKKEIEKGFYYLIESYKYDKERCECIYELIKYYTVENMHLISNNYYLLIKDYYEKKYLNDNFSNKLFVNSLIYDFYLPYYMIIVSEKIKDYNTGIKMYEIIFEKKSSMVDLWWIKNLFFNLRFFLSKVKNNNFVTNANSYIKYLNKHNVYPDKFDFFKEYINYGITVSVIDVPVINNKFTKIECKESNNILFYTGFLSHNWNYSYLNNNSLGGSEKAVAYLTKLFPKKFNIYVAGQVTNEEFDNIKYVDFAKLKQLSDTIPFHTIVVSRYIAFYEMFNFSFFQSFIWVHDTTLLHYGCNLSCDNILKKWYNYINGVVCLTNWHAQHIKEKYPIINNKITIINNGVNPYLFPVSAKKIKNRFIYTSRPERGLKILIELWPKILETLSDATLIVSTYYSQESEENKLILNKLKTYNSINFLGNLNTQELYKQMSISEYWLYPCIYSETSCITALEMLMSEVLCLYYPLAGLTDTMGSRGIKINPGNEIDSLLKLINLSENEKCNLRKEGKKYAESNSWENKVKEWERLLFTNNA